MHNLCYCFGSYLPTVCGYCKMISCVCPGFFHALILDAFVETVFKGSYFEPKNIILFIHELDYYFLLGPNTKQGIWYRILINIYPLCM